MAAYLGIGVFPLQLAEEGEDGGLLGWGPCVGGLTKEVESAFVADADGVGIVARAVGSDHGIWTAALYGAIAANNVVVAYHSPALGTVPRVYLACAGGLRRLDRRTVDDDITYLSHKGLMFLAV